jgi:hypothetical protein
MYVRSVLVKKTSFSVLIDNKTLVKLTLLSKVDFLTMVQSMT